MKKVKNAKIDKKLISIEAVCIYIFMPLLFFFTIKTPNIIEAIADFKRPFFSENGNNQITGQQGDIPFILSQSGDAIKKAGKQIAEKKIKKLLLI